MKKLLISSIFIVILLVFILSCNSKEIPNLNASVHFWGASIVVRNEDSFVWNDVMVKVNDKYVTNYDTIKPSQVVAIPYAEFSSSEGVRFNQFTTKVKSILIRASSPSYNNMYWYGQ